MEKKHLTWWLAGTNAFWLIVVVALLFLIPPNESQDLPVLQDQPAPDTADQPAAQDTSLTKETIIACFGAGKEQRRQKAMDDYQQISRKSPPYLGERTEIYSFAQKGDTQKAQSLCDYFLQFSQDKREPLYSQAWLFTNAGKYPQAIEASKKLIEQYPEFVKAHITLGWIYAKQSKLNEAANVCDEIIRLSPTTWQAYYGLGRLEAMLGRYDEARNAYENTVQIKPDFAEAYLFCGLTYALQQQWSQAVQQYRQATSFDRHYEEAYLFMAVAYDELALYKEAAEAAEFALQLADFYPDQQLHFDTIGIKPDYPQIRCGLAEVYARLGEYTKAVDVCRDAIAENPTFAQAYYYMALAHLLLDDTESASQQLQRLQSLNAPEMVENLRRLISG
jgi:tetratricopeptide (TPR) repeat protein